MNHKGSRFSSGCALPNHHQTGLFKKYPHPFKDPLRCRGLIHGVAVVNTVPLALPEDILDVAGSKSAEVPGGHGPLLLLEMAGGIVACRIGGQSVRQERLT